MAHWDIAPNSHQICPMHRHINGCTFGHFFFVWKETSIDNLHCDILIFELTNASLKLLVFTFGQLGPITLYSVTGKYDYFWTNRVSFRGINQRAISEIHCHCHCMFFSMKHLTGFSNVLILSANLKLMFLWTLERIKQKQFCITDIFCAGFLFGQN